MISHKLSKKTMFLVAVAHVVVLILAIILGKILTPTPAPKMLEMIGLPDVTDPAEGTPSAQARGPESTNTKPLSGPSSPPDSPSPPQDNPTQNPPSTATTPQVKPTNTQTQTRPPDPTPTTSRNDFPTEKPTTKPTKPQAPEVKVNLNSTTTRTVSTSNTASTTPGKPTTKPTTQGGSGSGQNANSIERQLNNALGGGGSGGNPNAGVRGGTGTQGSPGSPDGNANADWYRTLVKNVIERHWIKPVDKTDLSTTVHIKILKDGTLQFISMVKSSGDAQMDNSVIDAVRTAQKITPPPGGKEFEDDVVVRLTGAL